MTSVKAELKRLASGPQRGYFTFLHHDCLLESTTNLQERIDYIIREKPQKEHLVRLRHIRPVAKDMAVSYLDTINSAGAAYEAAVKPAWAAYEAAVKAAKAAYKAAVKPAWAAYEAAVKAAKAAYEAAVKPAWAAYEAAVKPAEAKITPLVPNCCWNGRSILDKNQTN